MHPAPMGQMGAGGGGGGGGVGGGFGVGSPSMGVHRPTVRVELREGGCGGWGGGGRGGAYLFVACFSIVSIDYASLSGRSGGERDRRGSCGGVIVAVFVVVVYVPRYPLVLVVPLENVEDEIRKWVSGIFFFSVCVCVGACVGLGVSMVSHRFSSDAFGCARFACA